jgi:o-succinylbenzoate synthase
VIVATRRVRWALPATGAVRGGDWREREAVIVAIEEDGATGLGEAAPLPGMSADTIDEAERDLARFEPGASPSARFAIETALAVLRAQRERTSVAKLLGGEHVVRAVTIVDDACAVTTPIVKIKVGAAPFGDDLARMKWIAAAAPGAAIRIDVNRRWPRGEVLARLAMTAGALGDALEYVEEPCAAACELLAGDLPCPVALDESLVAIAPGDLAAAVRSPGLAALVLKPTLLGGFTRCLELAALARAHGKRAVVTHALEGPVGRAACVELARAIGDEP